MDSRMARAVIEDFREWSGGFPPESKAEVLVYVEFARDASADAVEVTRLLYEWMVGET